MHLKHGTYEWPAEHELAEAIVEGFVNLVECLASNWKCFGEIAAHSDSLRALAREAERSAASNSWSSQARVATSSSGARGKHGRGGKLDWSC